MKCEACNGTGQQATGTSYGGWDEVIACDECDGTGEVNECALLTETQPVSDVTLLRDCAELLDKLVAVYAGELCSDEAVEASGRYFMDNGGVLYCIGSMVQRLRAADDSSDGDTT